MMRWLDMLATFDDRCSALGARVGQASGLPPRNYSNTMCVVVPATLMSLISWLLPSLYPTVVYTYLSLFASTLTEASAVVLPCLSSALLSLSSSLTSPGLKVVPFTTVG